jgi:magnesium chelatase family protein
MLPYDKSSNYRDHRSIDEISYFRIVGLPKAKRALMISAAGHHNILFHGSPGRGKTILARALRDLLTDMNKEEILQTSKVFSVAGLTDSDTPLIFDRPFREVHHTASTAAVIGGGGAFPKPGEISLAHNGVLLLDEITEFKKNVLESLRQPLEDGFININRANFSARFPCNFILIGTMNPCPCGYFGDSKTQCKCSENQVQNYQKKLSGPLLDRFDLFVEVEKTPFEEILSADGAGSKEIEDSLQKITLAKQIQSSRFLNHKKITRNSDMDLKEIRKFCELMPDAALLLNGAAEKLNLSNRSHLRVLKIARTIADLEKAPIIETPHIAEALQYRK